MKELFYGHKSSEESNEIHSNEKRSHANPHCKACNCRPEVIIFDEKPRLILRAIKDIRKNKELSYDYGERRPDVIKELPWLDHSKGKEKSTESEGETNSSDSDTV